MGGASTTDDVAGCENPEFPNDAAGIPVVGAFIPGGTLEVHGSYDVGMD